VSNTSKLLDQVRSQLGPSEEALGEARRRRHITKDAAPASPAPRVFNSGSLAHATANCPVHHRDQGLDADCGVVLDRRRFPSLGPDGSSEGPDAIVDDIVNLEDQINRAVLKQLPDRPDPRKKVSAAVQSLQLGPVGGRQLLKYLHGDEHALGSGKSDGPPQRLRLIERLAPRVSRARHASPMRHL
jgi:hypothetical protein